MNVEIAALKGHLTTLYGSESVDSILDRLLALLERYTDLNPRQNGAHYNTDLDEKDAILITYADMVQEEDELGLKTLTRFLNEHLNGIVNTIHILPFFPYSSDDGFSVIDYRAVNQQFGTWDDVDQIGQNFRLMFDAVINHVSSESEWFQAFLNDEEPYKDYFIVVPEGTDLSETFRPRALPLLTEFNTRSGPKMLWTTFSADQIDPDYGNPDVLLEIIDVLLFYVSKGAKFIRLDAVAYLWKEAGTSSIHLPQTHSIIQLFRSVLDAVAPAVKLITETNVPHADNISYFGDGYDEAQLVYNFPLPPLTLHAFLSGDASFLTSWAASLSTPSNQTTFMNFTASHDGIGLLPARDILGDKAVHEMADRIQSRGGYASYRDNTDGTRSPYELNMNYLEALSTAGDPEEGVELKARRFLASQAIMLALKGVPGIYFHSLVGSKGWPEGGATTGRPRTVNREKVSYQRLETELLNPGSLRHNVFQGYIRLLGIRSNNPAFHPGSDQSVLKLDNSVFAILRSSTNPVSGVLCLHNVSDVRRDVLLNLKAIGLGPTSKLVNLISGQTYLVDEQDELTLTLRPYGYLWLAGT